MLIIWLKHKSMTLKPGIKDLGVYQVLVCLLGIFSAIPRELYTTARSFWCLSLHAAGPESPGEADPSD